MKKIIKQIIPLIYIMTTFSCFLGGGTNAENSIVLSNDKTIETKNEVIDIYAEETTPSLSISRATKPPVSIGKTITYIAQIMPVNVDGDLVQSNDIIISSNTAYIAYNYAGEISKGAIQIVDISTPSSPIITAEIKFLNMDINTLDLDNNTLVFGGQANPDVYGFRSFIGKIDTKAINITAINSSIISLDSYATTGIAKHNNSYYVGVGALDGKLEILNSDLTSASKTALPDIRDIQTYQNGIVLIAGTADTTNSSGRVLIYKSSNMTTPEEISIPDFGSDYNKATIETDGNNYAFLGLSEAGFKVLDIKDTNSAIIYSLVNPVASGSLKYNTNSASSDGKNIFLANGEYGFRVLEIGNSGSSFELKGYHSFSGKVSATGLQYSANHIEFKNKNLFVAAGAGGVLVYLVE